MARIQIQVNMARGTFLKKLENAHFQLEHNQFCFTGWPWVDGSGWRATEQKDIEIELCLHLKRRMREKSSNRLIGVACNVCNNRLIILKISVMNIRPLTWLYVRLLFRLMLNEADRGRGRSSPGTWLFRCVLVWFEKSDNLSQIFGL